MFDKNPAQSPPTRPSPTRPTRPKTALESFAVAAFSSSSMDLDPADLAQDVHRLFEDLSRRRPDRRHVVAGECMPVVDVFETDRTVEIVLDLPGVAAEALRIPIKADGVLIVGEKERPALAKHTPASFHLVERDCGQGTLIPIDTGGPTAPE